MREINEAAEPILAELHRGVWWSLSADEKRKLSAWATMFTMTYEHADMKTLATPQCERTFLMESGQPPSNWKVWIGEYSNGVWSDTCQHKGASFNPSQSSPADLTPMNLQSTVFTFGKLLLNTFSTHADLNFKAAEYGFRLGLQTIWPINGSVIRKPSNVHGAAQVEFIAQVLEWATDDFIR